MKEYLLFREELFLNHSDSLNHLPEQYVLGHFLETLDTSILDPKYIENLKNYNSDLHDFNMSYIIDNFNNKIKLIKEKTEYYPIIAEIAKLNRAELAEFKKRYLRTIEKCQEDEIDLPYRMYLPRTDCAFVFIPLISKTAKHWETALTNYTTAQKYDQKATKCVGLAIFEIIIDNEKYFDMYWMFLEENWQHNKELEDLLSRNFPFREVKTKRIDNRYIK